VATASVADLHDLEAKVTKAMGMSGARYIHVHVPCPLGWGSAPCDTIRLARLAVETGLFPLFEAEHGEITEVTPIRRKLPVEAYLKPQRRFAHLFGKSADTDALAAIQRMADARGGTNGRSMSIFCRPATMPVRPAKISRPGSTTPRRATMRPPGGSS
jgi:pyruvate ferredoxin oxidoreductase beta subunit